MNIVCASTNSKSACEQYSHILMMPGYLPPFTNLLVSITDVFNCHLKLFNNKLNTPVNINLTGRGGGGAGIAEETASPLEKIENYFYNVN